MLWMRLFVRYNENTVLAKFMLKKSFVFLDHDWRSILRLHLSPLHDRKLLPSELRINSGKIEKNISTRTDICPCYVTFC